MKWWYVLVLLAGVMVGLGVMYFKSPIPKAKEKLNSLSPSIRDHIET